MTEHLVRAQVDPNTRDAFVNIVDQTSNNLCLLPYSSILFEDATLMGEGQYGMIYKVKISHPRFSNELLWLSIMHNGIISPLGLARHHSKVPCLIFKFWNGVTLDMWLEGMKKEFLNIPRSRGVKDTERDITTVKTNV
ncbi:hypothetical protein KP509_29G054500 [Ceratopteris richardii]|uniref:Protein kinase domain-containing protein n=1 Tax=Ceratopteris richardii TaxID=49495 RepID=A0A8T2R9F5_CERRI|nr:hypothetical protein KP509_29G054500 [Ceratopteris richardii]